MGRPCDWSCRDHPPYPPFARGGKGRNEIGMKAQLVQDQLFTSPEPLCRPPFPDAEPVLGPWRPPRPRHARQDQQHGGARRSVPAARSETPPSSRPWECAWFELNRWESSRCRAERTPRIGGSTLRFNRLADRVRRADPLHEREHRSSRTSWSRPSSCCSKPNRRCRTPLPASPEFILQAPPWKRSRRRSTLPERSGGWPP